MQMTAPNLPSFSGYVFESMVTIRQTLWRLVEVVVLFHALTMPAVAQTDEPASEHCPVTKSEKPGGWIENDVLGVHVPSDGTFTFTPGGPGFVDADGAVGIKWPWVRFVPGQLNVGGQRIDEEAPTARAYIPGGYGEVGFQSMYLVFPTAGCWEITGGVAGKSITFTVLIAVEGDGPEWRFNGPPRGWRVTTDWR